MILKRSKVFSSSNEALPFNTAVIARIRTASNEPVYSKLYPYPMGYRYKQLIKDGVFRQPSMGC